MFSRRPIMRVQPQPQCRICNRYITTSNSVDYLAKKKHEYESFIYLATCGFKCDYCLDASHSPFIRVINPTFVQLVEERITRLDHYREEFGEQAEVILARVNTNMILEKAKEFDSYVATWHYTRGVKMNQKKTSVRRRIQLDLDAEPQYKKINKEYENLVEIFWDVEFEFRQLRRRQRNKANFDASLYTDPFEEAPESEEYLDADLLLQRIASFDVEKDSVIDVPLQDDDKTVTFCYGHSMLLESFLNSLPDIIEVDAWGRLKCNCPGYINFAMNQRCSAGHRMQDIIQQLPTEVALDVTEKIELLRIRKWRHAIFNHYPDAEECPNVSCNHEGAQGIGRILTKETARSYLSSNSNIFNSVNIIEDVRECLTCGTIWCIQCQGRFLIPSKDEDDIRHDYLTCEEYVGIRNKEVDPSEVMIKKMAVTCPRCKMDIAISSGCDHITCSNCKGHFCYRCQNGAYDTVGEMSGSCDIQLHHQVSDKPVKGTIDVLKEL